MSFCNEKGMPHSEFLAWTPQDRAKALAYILHEAEKCSLCGTAPWEWEENKFAYEPQEHRCQGCYLKQTYSDSMGQVLPGTTVELVRITPTRRAQQIVQAEQRQEMLRED